MKKLAHRWEVIVAAVLGVGCGPIAVDVGDLRDAGPAGATSDGSGAVGSGGARDVPIDPGFGDAGRGASGGGGVSGRGNGGAGANGFGSAGRSNGPVDQPGLFDSDPSKSDCEGFATNWLLFDSDRADGERHIFSMRGDGSGIFMLAAPGEDPALSPDGTTLVYVVDGALIARQLPNGTVTPLGISGDQPAWSADGSRLAYHADNGIQILDWSTFTSRTLITCSQCRYGGYQHPEFVADGSALVVDRENEIDRVDLVTGFAEGIVRNWTITMSHPSASPDVAHVVTTLEGPSLWVSNYSEIVNPGEGIRLTPPAELATGPAWGPHDRIAYEQLEDDGERDIAVGDFNTHVRCVIPGAGDDANPTWAPEGFDPGGISN